MAFKLDERIILMNGYSCKLMNGYSRKPFE